jgi:hypothetical protein
LPIPSFTTSGVLPPYLGSNPGLQSELMSPYRATVTEVVGRFATSTERMKILAGWLAYRIAMREIGLDRGFQWLNGSFLEDKENLRQEPPNDLDLLFFMRRPSGLAANRPFEGFVAAHRVLFERRAVKAAFRLDLFLIDLDGDSEAALSAGRYLLQLFSHQRDTGLWKGMLEVRQEDQGDDESCLSQLTAAIGSGA